MATLDLGKVVGDSATIQVGTTTTLSAGSNATVENVGTSSAAIFNFGIPKGEDGEAEADYVKLDNKPSINNVELNGNKSLNDLGVQPAGNYALQSEIPDVSNFITKNVNDLTYYYTKTEVDGKVSAVYKYKGTVSTYSDLPSTDLTIGDVYNVETDGSNYAWTGTAWDKLGGDIDLSGYQTKIDSTHKLSSDLVDDTSATNKFVTASDKTTWNAKYDKPSGGIPSTDLSSAVQTSLGKADTALQAHQDISGKEDKTNKVTSISSSSTNTEYPSALAVYDHVENNMPKNYLGKTDAHNTQLTAINLNELKKGVYILRHAASNNTLWLKATYKGNQNEPVTRTLEITLFNDLQNTNLILNEILLYIDETFDEQTVSVSKLGSLTITFKDSTKILSNSYRTIKLNNNAIALGTETFEDFGLASKNYVDSSIASAITDALGGSY